jgi:hypothetical protein
MFFRDDARPLGGSWCLQWLSSAKCFTH